MSDNANSSTSGGVGFFGLLGVVFIVLKMTHVIDWSWWWVTAPFWGAFLLWLLIVGIVLIVALSVGRR